MSTSLVSHVADIGDEAQLLLLADTVATLYLTSRRDILIQEVKLSRMVASCDALLDFSCCVR
jgi:hypothetical protein